MKQKLTLLLTVLALVVTALGFSGTSPKVDRGGCPLCGTPACPDYRACGK
ncbi:MAG: hypothetical protein HYR76_01235 [Ignavibacteria bacterium]|nr:hypothetical protein [Ignavibacteria bacterium]MBI3766294.1 hypothetical protein [Ignavibacteriales bacterium]